LVAFDLDRCWFIFLHTSYYGKKKKKSHEQKQRGGGCLIATATFGSELAPQVQQLRELRDNTLLQTDWGSVFMGEFNQIYYLFSPTIADWERQNPAFKEAVKLFITPMISSLSIMTLADSGSEFELLVFGVSVIALNIGSYIVAPKLHLHTQCIDNIDTESKTNF